MDFRISSYVFLTHWNHLGVWPSSLSWHHRFIQTSANVDAIAWCVRNTPIVEIQFNFIHTYYNEIQYIL